MKPTANCGRTSKAAEKLVRSGELLEIVHETVADFE